MSLQNTFVRRDRFPPSVSIHDPRYHLLAKASCRVLFDAFPRDVPPDAVWLDVPYRGCDKDLRNVDTDTTRQE